MRNRKNRRAVNNEYKARFGTETPLFAQIEEIWQQQFAAMSFKIAAKFQTPLFDFEERRQIALLGILAASQSFNGMPNNSRAYWAWRKGCHAVATAIRNEINRQKKEPPAVEIDSYAEPSASENPLDALIRQEESEKQKKQIWRLRRALKKLPERTREIVSRLALNSERQEDVARTLGLSQSWVSRIYAQGIEELRGLLVCQE